MARPSAFLSRAAFPLDASKWTFLKRVDIDFPNRAVDVLREESSQQLRKATQRCREIRIRPMLVRNVN